MRISTSSFCLVVAAVLVSMALGLRACADRDSPPAQPAHCIDGLLWTDPLDGTSKGLLVEIDGKPVTCTVKARP